MKIGLISDIHGNEAGLRRALDLMGDVDELLCMGDCVSGFSFSNEVVATLKAREALVVQGNHDADYLRWVAHKPSQEGKADPELVDWLRNQPERRDIDMAGKRFVMVHSTPWSRDYVWPQTPEVKRFAEIDADFVLGGHTHTPFSGRFGRALAINPGSAGEWRFSRQNPERNLTCMILDPASDEIETLSFPEI